CLKATKRFLHRTCKKLGLNTAVAPVNGPANELLILKTNYNCGGLAESWLTREHAIRLGRMSRTSPFSGPLAYPVLRRCQVAPKYWRMRSVVVEKYIQHPDQRIFRGYVFGNAGVLSEGVNAARIKKMYPGIPRKNHRADLNRSFRGRDPALQNIHDQMRRLVAGLALDYAAIDFVCDNRNRAFAIDINLTPHWGSESQPWLIRHLRRGLHRL
ncbi:MAG TPA: hypothetical protein VJS17_13025, partial [Pyrinomonadaceae bacterium]|nr:hypothetical protein [Pyrinomonadaceae bacterium]